MPFIPAANTARIEMVFSQGGQIVENVYHVEFASAPDPTMLIDMAEVFKNWWNTNVQPYAANTLSLNVIKARDLTTEAGSAIEYTTGLPISGASAVQPLPNGSTLAIKWTTGLAGRSFRGRTYHLGLVTSELVDPNHISSGFQTTLAGAYQALITAVEGTTNNLVVASFYHGVDSLGKPIPRAAAVLTVIDNAVVNSTLDSQRRRLPERGS